MLPQSIRRFWFLSLLFLASAAHADKYWVATTSGSWNNSINWAIASGGVGGFQVPVATDTVIFDGVKVGTCVINANVLVSSITISTSNTGGYTGTINVLSTVTVTARHDFILNKGTFTALNSTVTVSRNFSINVGTFTTTNSSITIGGRTGSG